jgi:mRNA-degrading endonuclease RelE of RelBE toxin-antitoxin system
LITKDVREDYNAQLKSDCKKWRKRIAESRLIILKELGISMELYEKELSKLSKDERSEKVMYNKILKELSETPEYASTKKKAKDYIKEYYDCLKNQMAVVAVHPQINQELSKELGPEYAEDLPDIMALDQMYSTYKITYTELCMAKLLAEKSKK